VSRFIPFMVSVAPSPSLQKFRWDDLVDLITSTQVVVPVIGDGAITLVRDGQERPFSEVLAERLAQMLEIELTPGASLRAVASAALRDGTPQLLRSKLFRAHEELMRDVTREQLGGPLRLLSEIDDFPLILTTATHGLLDKALHLTRQREPEVVALGAGEDLDLRTSWAPSAKPTVVHLFGRVSRNLNFALTEEDILESLWGLQKDRRPERLLDVLSTRSLLFIGNRFPDWLARMFMRSMRRSRLSEDRATIKALAEDGIQDEPQLVLFLESLGQQTWIYRSGDVCQFVGTLHERWSEMRSDRRELPGTSAPARTEMPDGAVFISYSSGDEAAARAVRDQFDENGLDAWFDERELRAGDQYDLDIRRSIERCELFVAVISATTEGRDEAYFRREWRLAIERSRGMAEGRRFIVPIVVGGLAPKELKNVPQEFRERTVEGAADGRLSETLMEQLVKDVRLIRSRGAQR